MTEKYKGIPVSKGIVIGHIYKYVKEEPIFDTYNIKETDIENEINRLQQARIKAGEILNSIKDKARKELGKEEIKIFAAHKCILNDPLLDKEIKKIIRSKKINAETAVKEAIDNISGRFVSMNNDYFQERIKDIRDVGNHLIRALAGGNRSLRDIPQDTIIIAEELTPSEIALLDKERLKGFVLARGGETSHTTIMARSLMLPTVINVNNILTETIHGKLAILDALKGEVIINPDQEHITIYRRKIEQYKKERDLLYRLKDKPAETLDGHRIMVAANINTSEDMAGTLKVRGDGIGLFRTELLYIDKDQAPDEKKQFSVYRDVVEKMAPNPVVIRTLDIGGDKDLPYFKIDDETNPFLGWRGIRILLDRIDLFKTQLRAILRASVFGDIRILLPLISSLEELHKALEIIKEVKVDLRAEGINFSEQVKVGIMIEVPSTAVLADFFASEIDFFSIGTNDLIQYTLAVDRTNNKIVDLYTPYHPAVLNLINRVAEAAHYNGIEVAICGETAANPLLSPIFVGMGIIELSMNSGSILEIKKVIRKINHSEAKQELEKVLKLRTATEIEAELKKFSERLI